MNINMSQELKYLEYKGKALVREHDTICYGNMTESHILFMMVMSYRNFGNERIPDNMLIQIISTDKSKSFHERIVKQGEKNGLYEAFDIGMIWLERELVK